VPTCPWPDKAAGTARCRSGEAVDSLVDELIVDTSIKQHSGMHGPTNVRLESGDTWSIVWLPSRLCMSHTDSIGLYYIGSMHLHLNDLTTISYMIGWNQLFVCQITVQYYRDNKKDHILNLFFCMSQMMLAEGKRKSDIELGRCPSHSVEHVEHDMHGSNLI